MVMRKKKKKKRLNVTGGATLRRLEAALESSAELGGGGLVWDPKGGETVFGKFVRLESPANKRSSPVLVYSDLKGGGLARKYAPTALADFFSDAPPGTPFAIGCLGKKEGVKVKGKKSPGSYWRFRAVRV